MGPVSAPAAVKTLIALLLAVLAIAFGAVTLPLIVLFRTWNVRFEICDVAMSTPCPLPVKVLFWTMMLFAAVSVVVETAPEFTPILPESFV